MERKAVVVIPCRIGSTRYPRKPLAVIAGRTMMERVWRLASVAKGVDRVIVATDSSELEEVAKSFGAEVFMTSESCRTGTDRVAEVSERLPDCYDIVLNFQGDSPLTPPTVLEGLVREMKLNPLLLMATPMQRLAGQPLASMVAQKKAGGTTGTLVTFDCEGNALYFSKGMIPNLRDGLKLESEAFLHIGIYAYTRQTLGRLARLKEGRFEKQEKLEQLRALENGISIRMVEVELGGRSLASVDSPEDVAIVEAIIAREGELLTR